MRYQSGKWHSNRGLGDITQPQLLSTMAPARHRRHPIGIPHSRPDGRAADLASRMTLDTKVPERQNAALAISAARDPRP
jgi:hypothetical protein